MITRRGRRVAVVSALVVVTLAVVGAVQLLRHTPLGAALGFGGSPACTLTTADGDVEWSAVQAMTATTVAGVGTRIGASENGVAAAVRRSLAVEREVEVSVPEARETYRRLPDVARPDDAALAVGRALTGVRGPALTCTTPPAGADLPQEALGPRGLTPRADTVRAELRATFGRQSLGGFEPGGVSSGHTEGSAHYDGRALDVFYRPVTAAGTAQGWQLAMWGVAHAERLSVATVIFDRRLWSAARSVQGWRDYERPDGPTDNPILLHEDHVHLDVAPGG